MVLFTTNVRDASDSYYYPLLQMKKRTIYYVPGTGLSITYLLIHLLCSHTSSDWLTWDSDAGLPTPYAMSFPHSQTTV